MPARGPGLPARHAVDRRRPLQRAGALNGFIAGWEKGLAWATGNEDFINWDRTGEDAFTGTGELVTMDGVVLRQDDGLSGWGLSDAQLALKAALWRSAPGRFVPDVAVRLVANAANRRALKPRGRRDAMGLELKPLAFGGTLGYERRLDAGRLKDLSLGLQLNYNQSPYKYVDQISIDGRRSDVTLGFSYLAKLGTQKVLLQIYGREDLNLNPGGGGLLTPYSPPDFQAGLRATWTP